MDPLSRNKAIIFREVWESFELPHSRTRSLKQKIMDTLLFKRQSVEHFQALKGISFEIEPGDIVGIVGENGSGKSTILNLIAGIYRPDRGAVTVNGTVSALLELGTGFHPELTGRENVFLTGSLLGMSNAEISLRLPRIIEFAGIGPFIDVPIKTYSTGMYLRLAFALAISVEADILLVDEVLAVGDIAFQQKCIAEILAFRDAGKTILFVSHDMATVRGLCKRVLLMKDGQIRVDGEAGYVLDYYYRTIGNPAAIKEMNVGPYNLLFNNGTLSIMVRNKFLTIDESIFYELYLGDDKVPSYSGAWTLLPGPADGMSGMSAECFFPLHRLKVLWHIRCDNHGFNLEIIVTDLDETNGPRLISGHVNIVLQGSFGEWADAFFEQTFPDVPPDRISAALSGPQPLANSRFLGCRDAEGNRLMIEIGQSNTLSRFQVLNSGGPASRRTIRIAEQPPAGATAMSGARSEITGSYRFSINIPDTLEQEKRRQAADLISIRQADTCLYFDGSHFHILLEHGQITQNLGIFSTVNHKNSLYDSPKGQWRVWKDNNALCGILVFAHLPGQQEWQFRFSEQGTLVLAVELAMPAELRQVQFHLNTLVSANYSQWTDVMEQGIFPEISPDDLAWGLVCKKLQNSNIVVFQDPDSGKNVLVEHDSPDSHMHELLYNSEFAHPARIVKFIDPRPAGTDTDDTAQPRGKKNYRFRFSCNQTQDMVQAHLEHYRDRISLSAENMLLIFSGSQFHVFWQGTQVTKGLGLYTSIYSENQWHDSHQAFWSVQKSENCLEGTCLLSKLPLRQLWKFSFRTRHELVWHIDLEVMKPIALTRLQTNIMLDERYALWKNGRAEQGAFPERFTDDFGGDWEILSSHQSNAGPVSAFSKTSADVFLPAVTFFLASPDDDFQANIVSSDSFFRSRLLQLLKRPQAGQELLLPGIYTYSRSIIQMKKM